MKTKNIGLISFISLYFLNIGQINPIAYTGNLDLNVEEINKTENSTTLRITKDTNVKNVRLPNGNWVSDTSFTYTINRNGDYDFVYNTIDGASKKLTVPINSLRNNYLITNNPNVLLNLKSEDMLSGMGFMKFRNEIGAWSPYEVYKTTKDWTLDNEEGLKTVFATFKDIAGNETSEVYDKIILDKTGPTINTFTINNGQPYTKVRNVTLNVSALDNYSKVSKLLISNDNINWTEVNYQNNIPWVLTENSSNKTVYIKAVDSLGNIGITKTASIYLDEILPTGSISINNGDSLTNSRNVKLQISFRDVHSGIKRATIIEKDTVYNIPNVPKTTNPVTMELPWTLKMGSTGQVTLEVEDNAGNVYRTNSKVISIATLEVTQFRLLDVVNPAKPNFTPITWPFPAQEMKSGANISFDINYSLELDGNTTSIVNGEYCVEVIGENYHKIIKTNYDNKIANGFSSTIKIPDDAPKGSKIYLSSKLTATLTNNSETFKNEAFFPNVNEKALIGIISGNIKEDIIFNEIQ